MKSEIKEALSYNPDICLWDLYTGADVIDMTAGITINHAVRTGKSWISGKLNDIARISVACGFSETLYDGVPDYIESISDIR